MLNKTIQSMNIKVEAEKAIEHIKEIKQEYEQGYDYIEKPSLIDRLKGIFR